MLYRVPTFYGITDCCAVCHFSEYHSLCWVSLYWVSLYWVSLYWVSLYWVSLFWVSLYWESYWVSLYWVSLNRVCGVSICYHCSECNCSKCHYAMSFYYCCGSVCYQTSVIMTLHHTVVAKCQSLCCVGVKMTARLSSEHLYVNALQVSRLWELLFLLNWYEPDIMLQFLCVVFCGM